MIHSHCCLTIRVLMSVAVERGFSSPLRHASLQMCPPACCSAAGSPNTLILTHTSCHCSLGVSVSEETACIEAWDRHVLVRQRGTLPPLLWGTKSALALKEASARQEFVQMQILHHDAVCKGQLERLEVRLSAEHARGIPERFGSAELQPGSLRDLRPGSVSERDRTGVRKHVVLEPACSIRKKMG